MVDTRVIICIGGGVGTRGGKFIPFRDVFENEDVIPTNEFVGLWRFIPSGDALRCNVLICR